MLTSACEAALVFPLLSLTEFFSGAETDSRELSCGVSGFRAICRALSALSPMLLTLQELQLVAGVGPQTPGAGSACWSGPSARRAPPADCSPSAGSGSRLWRWSDPRPLTR